MQITEITRWKFNGKEYDKLSSIKTDVENRIGAIIEYSDVTLTPKQKLNLHASICKHRHELIELLSVCFETENENINILDLNK